MEKWLLDNALEIVILLGGGIFAFIKLHNFQSGTGQQVVGLISKFQSHLESPIPHTSCPVHNIALADIKQSIDEVKGQIKALDNRLFALLSSKFRESDER